MKQELKIVFQDLRDGRLSKAEALERIRALKAALMVEDAAGSGISGASTLIAIPHWEEMPASPAAGPEAGYGSRHVLLGGFRHLEADDLAARLSQARCSRLQGGPAESPAEAYTEAALDCFARIREILQEPPRAKALVQVIVPDEPRASLLAGLSGLLRTASLENPNLMGQVILIDGRVDAETLAGCLHADSRRPQDALIRHRDGRRFISAWREAPSSGAAAVPVFKEGGAYLITGGLGGLGRILAREILGRTRKARVILTGRSALDAGKRSDLEALGAPGSVEYRQLDIAKPEQVDSLFAELKAAGGLDGILHCAGVLHDDLILRQSREDFLRVLAPKVAGACNLDRASQDLDLDFFILFSSIASVFGNVGQAAYAAANGFLDRFAAHRNHLAAQGLRKGKALALNWPLWNEGGMRLDAGLRDRLRRETGLAPLDTAAGLRAFHLGPGLPSDQALVLAGEPLRLRRKLSGLADAAPTSLPAPETAVADGAADPEAWLEKAQAFLCRQFAAQLKMPAQAIDVQAPLGRYGMDSIMAMGLTSALEKTFGPLSKTLFFEFHTVREIAGYFSRFHAATLAQLFAAEGGPARRAAEDAPARPAPSTRERERLPRRAPRRGNLEGTGDRGPVAIIGLSGRYPGAADVEEFWRNLRDGRDCITEVPPDRWDWRKYYSEDRGREGSHGSKWGGFIADVDKFDPRFFSIPPREAHAIDPQERLFLEQAWLALEDAGHTRAGLQIPRAGDLPGQVGVYAGVMYGEYNLSGSLASIANRVSYFLNLHGPSMTVDSMCSSSLTAIHLACQDLKLGRTDLAIAGGVNVSVHPGKYLMLSKGRFISGDGHCQSFGEGGDGYIPGEGVGAVVLKRLADAERDGDNIHGVILASALNHGGRTNGYSVPNPNAQAAVIGRALQEAGLDPRRISYVEAHGTGTKLGDPIEIAALSGAFRGAAEGACLIGSAKSNIGHCESAAGIAGLTKVLLQMRYRKVAPSLHSARLNPHIDFAKTPFVVNQTLRDWEPPRVDGRTAPRVAGISSFGAGGSNAHLVVEEFAASAAPRGSGSGVRRIFPLSARTAEQLRQKARDLLGFLQAARAGHSALDMEALAFTLQVGREEMEERLGLLAGAPDQLAGALESFLAGKESGHCFAGQAKRERDALALFSADADMRETLGKWISEGKLEKLADLWVRGLELDWNRFYSQDRQGRPARISLPGYPFARERYWLEPAGIPAPPAADTAVTAPVTDISPVTVIHPLLHVNVSDLHQAGYAATFTGEEPFLAAGHELPAAACLEMARAAVEKASGRSGGLELRHVAWGQPLLAERGKQAFITLFARSGDQVDFEIHSRKGQEDLVHCQGHAFPAADAAAGRIDPAVIAATWGRGKEGKTFYAGLSEAGHAIAPSLQGIVSIQRGEGQVLARLRAPEAGAEAYGLHPALLDGALQACAGIPENPVRALSHPSFPFAIASLHVLSPCAGEMWAWARASGAGEGNEAALRFDVDLCDADGNIRAQIRGISLALAAAPKKRVLALAIPVAPAPASHAQAAPDRKAAPGRKSMITLSSLM
ncbi:MAG TPA: SDR family NAD(P)-dependent oxidoreductase [Fibrobacteria bacterium]|nr:SDR family NAD(P)-dependent oxidoreductase [Fibrobacteria bacterium]